MLDKDKDIIQEKLSEDQYYATAQPKTQIVIHHTASGANPHNIIHGWQFSPERVATAFVIAGREDSTSSYKEGTIYQCYSSAMWAYHLGLHTANNEALNKGSVGIEVANWGQLILKDGKFYNYVNKEVPKEQVVEYPTPFRGFKYYHKYTDKQIDSLKNLILYLCDKYKISKVYNENIFEVNNDALSGKNGVWSHVSYRTDKVDMHPQPELISMLKSL